MTLKRGKELFDNHVIILQRSTYYSQLSNMANNEAALQTLIARYESKSPDSPLAVERLEYPRFVDRYAGFLASDATLLLTVEPLDAAEDDKKIRVVRLREYEEGADVRGQLIRPQSVYQAHQMAEGTARHDKRVEAYEDASVLR